MSSLRLDCCWLQVAAPGEAADNAPTPLAITAGNSRAWLTAVGRAISLLMSHALKLSNWRMRQVGMHEFL